MGHVETVTLEGVLKQRTRDGLLYEKLPNDWIRCYSCGHRCKIAPGRDGICRVRYNEAGILKVPWGYVGSMQLDPIEKKPFFHAFPGAQALSFGMLGCDYHCSYCQNWVTSQALRDPIAGAPPEYVSPEQFVDVALRYKARVVTSTYNEPLITSEWAVDIFKVARQAGLATSYVSNGNGTHEVLDFIKPWLDLYKVDLKGFNDKNYRQLGGLLKNVLDTIRMLKERKFWIEIVTLLVPGFNDSNEELKEIADYIASVDVNIPWHVTAFHKDYKMTGPDNTPVETLLRAVEIGHKSGLNFVYAGNLPGMTAEYENTYCPSCRTLLVERYGFRVLKNTLIKGACPKCKTKIPGVWTDEDLKELRAFRLPKN
ncbi:MAG: AmmeMemoRadiSam system radical SAM enzyme [Bacteroidota bacterium]